MNIVLHQPEIPSNTGNIGRTCTAAGSSLHLIEPLGFHLTEREIRRAGMDYWAELDLTRHVNYEAFLAYVRERAEKMPSAPELYGGTGLPDAGVPDPGAAAIRAPRIWYATTKAHRLYTEADFGPGDYIMFGKESAGIPEEILVDNEETCIRIPMGAGIRSLNLANSVAIVLYEALRQNGFPGLVPDGELHRLHWKENS